MAPDRLEDFDAWARKLMQSLMDWFWVLKTGVLAVVGRQGVHYERWLEGS